MKILLVAMNAKYIHSNPAVYSLQCYADENGIQTDIIEFTINQSIDTILQELYLLHPDFIGFSCYIWNIEPIRTLVREYAKLDMHASIWLGGPEVSHAPLHFMQELPALTGIMCGEGEATFLEVIRAARTQASETDFIEALSSIKGIVYRDRQTMQIFENPPRLLLDFSSLPFLYKKERDLDVFRNRIVYYESARGCPFRCSYCLSSIDKTTRIRDTSLVINELHFFLELKVPQVKFIDRTFNFEKSRAMEIWEYLILQDNKITNFHFEIKGDLLDEEQLHLLSKARPGLFQFEIGVQSTSQKTLETICRRTDLSKLKQAVDSLRKENRIHLHLDLIAGLPYEDAASFAASFQDVYAMRPNQLQLGFLKLLQGSLLHSQAEQFGIVVKEYPPYEVVKTAWLSFYDIIHLKEIEEMVEQYFNSGQFTYSLQYLEHFFENSFQMFEALALYYTENKIHLLQHARIRRYEILLDCMLSLTHTASFSPDFSIPLLKELLTLDAYLRENLKSRPSFAALQPHGDKGKSRSKESLQSHTELFHFDLQEGAQSGKAVYLEKICVFDYDRRDPMTHNAYYMLTDPYAE